MKKSLITLLPAVAILIGTGGCKPKADSKPATVASYKEYTDPVYAYKVQQPEGWLIASQPASQGSQVDFYSTQAISDAFTSFEPKGNRGAKIEAFAVAGNDAKRDQLIAEFKSAFKDSSVIKAPEQTTLNGMPATKISYSFDLDDTKFTGERYYFVQDSVVTYLETAVIGNFSDYSAVFQKVTSMFQAGKTPGKVQSVASTTPGDTSTKVRDSIVTVAPSADMKPYSGADFSMSYPSNFDPTSSGSGVDFGGARGDSRVKVSVRPAKGATLDKIAESSKSSFHSTGSKTTVGGNPAYVFPYGQGDVAAQIYLVVVHDKIFQITASWFKPQQALYQPAFEKMLASFKAK